MKETAKGLYQFWTGFGIPAYPENAVPDDAALPYITYELIEPNWRDSSPYYARIWYRDPSYVGITTKCDEVADAIGEGKRLVIEDGYVYLFKDQTFIQFQPVEATDELVKVAYLQMICHVLRA